MPHLHPGDGPYIKGRGKQNQLEKSAIGRLLFGNGVANDGLRAALTPVAHDAVDIIQAPDSNTECYQPKAESRTLRPR